MREFNGVLYPDRLDPRVVENTGRWYWYGNDMRYVNKGTDIEFYSIDTLSKDMCSGHEGDCVCKSRHRINIDNYNTLEWVALGASIVGSNDTDTVDVETTDHKGKKFTLKCIVDDGVVVVEQDVIHYRQTAISRVVEVDADLLGNHKAYVWGDYDSIEWVVDGAEILSGQGTDTIKIEMGMEQLEHMPSVTIYVRKDDVVSKVEYRVEEGKRCYEFFYEFGLGDGDGRDIPKSGEC